MKNIIIRQATAEDIDSLVSLLRQLFSIEVDFTFNSGLQRQGLSLLLADTKRSRIFVAEKDNQIIGMLTIQLLISTAQGGPVGLIEDVIVDSDYRQQGIGKQLLTKVEQWAKDNNLSRLQLLADKTNRPALSFYHRLSWNKTNLICLRKSNI